MVNTFPNCIRICTTGPLAGRRSTRSLQPNVLLVTNPIRCSCPATKTSDFRALRKPLCSAHQHECTDVCALPAQPSLDLCHLCAPTGPQGEGAGDSPGWVPALIPQTLSSWSVARGWLFRVGMAQGIKAPGPLWGEGRKFGKEGSELGGVRVFCGVLCGDPQRATGAKVGFLDCPTLPCSCHSLGVFPQGQWVGTSIQGLLEKYRPGVH